MKYARLIIFIQCILFSVPGYSAESRKNNRLLLPAANSFCSKTKIAGYSTASLSDHYNSNIRNSPLSTIIFNEEFDGLTGFPPEGWKTINADGGGTTGPWFQGNSSIFYAFSGEGYAAANYQGANDFYIDEWLISPKIISISDLDTLQFWHRSPDYSAWDDSLEVRISTTDTAITSFTIRLGNFKTSTYGWSLLKYPLKNIVASGSDIYIAFRYLLYNGGISGLSSDYVGLDLVQIVSPQVQKDIEVSSIDYPFLKSKIPQNSPITPTVTFQNAGLISKENIPVKLKIISPSGIIQETNDTIASLPAGQTMQKEFSDYLPLETGQYTIWAYSLMADDQNQSNDSIFSIFRTVVFVSGIYTVGDGGNIPTLAQALDTINNNILSGDVTISLISTLYNEPPLTLGPVDYTSSPTRIVIKPGGEFPITINVSSTVEKPYGLAIHGTTNVTVDGSYSTGNERKITLNSIGRNGMIGILIGGIEGAYADSNQIKNLIIRTGADSLVSSEGYYGILLYGFDAYFRDAGNKIINCDISKHGAVGIGVQWQIGSLIENNKIHDWVQLSGSNDVHGIWLGEAASNIKISGNKIGNIQTNVNYSWAYGIENGSGEGSSVKIFNNMIYNILANGSGVNANISRGIYSSSTLNMNDAICYNSIYLSGVDSSDNIKSHSAAIDIAGGKNLMFLNNILFNNINFVAAFTENKSYCYYFSVLPENFVSDHNNFYTATLYGIVGYYNGDRTTLEDWKNAFLSVVDTASIYADPFFIQPGTGNLHIDPNAISLTNSAGIPVAEMSTDIDGDLRNPVSPDIGADEFIPGGSAVEATYQPGWNLLSVPVIVEDFRKSSVFPTSSSSAFEFNSGYALADTLETGKGYWLKFNLTQQMQFTGLPLSSDTIRVCVGWNMVGSLSDTVRVSEIIQVPEDIVDSKFYFYNGSYFESEVIVPGRAYWVKLKSDGKLIFNN